MSSLRSPLPPLTSKMPELRGPPYLVGTSAYPLNPFPGTEHCVLASSDSAVKQILLTMNERDNFIVEDLDDFHIIIKADEEYRVRKQLELEVRRRSLSRGMALMFLSVGEEHVQFGMMCLLPSRMRNGVCLLSIQARSHIHISLQLPRYPRRKLESRQRPSERSNNLFHSIPQS